MPHSSLDFDSQLIRRYDIPGPRYTSYPTAIQFAANYTVNDYQQDAAQNADSHEPLSLYVHIPFCASVCFYCACTKVITKNRRHAAHYLSYLLREMAMKSALHGAHRPVQQLHWGGGTPTFLSHAEMTELMTATAKYFQLLDGDRGEYSIEIDPRTADASTIKLLRELGFNRLSCGVQDFEPSVQRAVNRVQSETATRTVVDTARATGFQSISFDLIYGLPLQTTASFQRTLEKVIAIRPDRLAIFNYAHMPQLFKTQRQIHSEQLPSAETKLAILKLCIETLSAAGYCYIGMDHFALPNDSLTLAQQQGSLHRNFQGYTTHANCDLVALGVSAIGSLENSFNQNHKDLPGYYASLDAGKLPLARGYRLDQDDRIRRALIMQLICHFELDIPAFQQQWRIDFATYFAAELHRLTEMQTAGLISVTPEHLQVLPAGRLLIRNICMAFDHYLKEPQQQQRYSKAI